MCELVHLLSERHVIWSSSVIVPPQLLTSNPFNSRPRPASHARDRGLLLPTPYGRGSFEHTPGTRPVPGAPTLVLAPTSWRWALLSVKG